MDASWLYAIGGVALLALVLASRALARAGKASEEAEQALESLGPSGADLVAIIAAAVAATGDMPAGSFRIASVEPVYAPQAGAGGFNTPVWGHVDRLVRACQNR
jgi:hypothetical protein